MTGKRKTVLCEQEPQTYRCYVTTKQGDRFNVPSANVAFVRLLDDCANDLFGNASVTTVEFYLGSELVAKYIAL